MKFLADMGISPATVALLRTIGHEAKHLHEEKLHRLSDTDILEKARAEAAIVLTHDLDFGALMAASRERLPSVVIFRLPDMRPANVNRHLVSCPRTIFCRSRAWRVVERERAPNPRPAPAYCVTHMTSSSRLANSRGVGQVARR